jgi:hypothetical protein
MKSFYEACFLLAAAAGFLIGLLRGLRGDTG